MVSSCIEENVSVCTALDASPVSPCCWCRLVDADAVGGTWPTPTCQVNYRVESVDPMSGRVQDESLLTHLMRHTGFWFSFFFIPEYFWSGPKVHHGRKIKIQKLSTSPTDSRAQPINKSLSAADSTITINQVHFYDVFDKFLADDDSYIVKDRLLYFEW